MLRRLMLAMAGSRALVSLLASLGRRSGLAKRFIAGESLKEALPAVRELESHGIDTTLDLLGEGVLAEEQSVSAAKLYRRLLRRIEETGLKSSISIKLTQLGLDISPDLCSQNLNLILKEAEVLKNFVRIDMEGSSYTQATIEIFRKHLEKYGPRRVGIVIQSYLYRSEEDVRSLLDTGCNIRLCKGAYMEPQEVAFPAKKDVDENFKKLLTILLGSDLFCAIATHDERMIDYARKLISESGVNGEKYEFQMLFGIRRERQLELREQGFGMRVYVPFGTQWAPYYIRRLAERPANLLFAARNLFRS